MRTIPALSLACAIAMPGFAQTGAGAPPAPIVRMGTEIMLRTRVELTTAGKHLKTGDQFALAVAQPVKVGDQTVIPAGAEGIGEITSVRNKGMWGRSGNITARVLYVTVNGRKVRLVGALGGKGKGGGVGAFVASTVLGPGSFFITGTSARIPAGFQVVARLDEDLRAASDGNAVSTPIPVQTAALALK